MKRLMSIIILGTIFLFSTSVQATQLKNVYKIQDAHCECDGIIEINVSHIQCNALLYSGTEWELLLNHSVHELGDDYLSDLMENNKVVYRFENLCPGIYTVELKAQVFEGIPMSHIAIGTIEILGSGDFDVTVTPPTGTTCHCEATATFQITQGVAPYFIYDCSGNLLDFTENTTYVAEDLCEGNLCFVIKDANGCEKQVNFTVPTQHPEVTFDLITTDMDCDDPPNSGTVTETNVQGTNNYTMSYSVPPTQHPEGYYVATLTDLNTGCTFEKEYYIHRDYGVDIDVKVIQPNACPESGYHYDKGHIIITEQPYLIVDWLDLYNDYNEFIRRDLEPGTYSVVYWIDLDCPDTLEIEILDIQNEFDGDVIATKHPGCNNANDGSFEIHVWGGLGEYELEWCDGTPIKRDDYEITEEDNNYPWKNYRFENLPAGQYCIKVKDPRTGCPPITLIVDLIDKSAVNITWTAWEEKNPSCESHFQIAELTGTPPFDIEWLDENGNVISSETWDGLTPPNPEQVLYTFPAYHGVRITDANGCEAVDGWTNWECEKGKGVVGIFSNPVPDHMTVQLGTEGTVTTAKTKILNTSFNQVQVNNHGSLLPGVTNFVIDVSSLAPGIYYIYGEFEGIPVGELKVFEKLP